MFNIIVSTVYYIIWITQSCRFCVGVYTAVFLNNYIDWYGDTINCTIMVQITNDRTIVKAFSSYAC